jgi:hypothetical protein
VGAHGGSVCWNDFRKRWITIILQRFGKPSIIGEVWYGEADAPVGPWVYVRKVVTHTKMSLYNVKQNPMLDKDGGRTIFFEGTYVNSFSGNPDQTPRYNYNQVMFKLDLAHPRLAVPVPVYVVSKAGPPSRFGTLTGAKEAARTAPIAFFAAELPGQGMVPVHHGTSPKGDPILTLSKPADAEARPVFHALPANAEEPPAATTPLYEFVNRDTGARAYATDENWASPGYHREDKPLCRVWADPGVRF